MAEDPREKRPNAGLDDISENDPLAALARIVAPDGGPQPRRNDSEADPQIDLEAELLKELGAYGEETEAASSASANVAGAGGAAGDGEHKGRAGAARPPVEAATTVTPQSGQAARPWPRPAGIDRPQAVKPPSAPGRDESVSGPTGEAGGQTDVVQALEDELVIDRFGEPSDAAAGRLVRPSDAATPRVSGRHGSAATGPVLPAQRHRPPEAAPRAANVNDPGPSDSRPEDGKPRSGERPAAASTAGQSERPVAGRGMPQRQRGEWARATPVPSDDRAGASAAAGRASHGTADTAAAVPRRGETADDILAEINRFSLSSGARSRRGGEAAEPVRSFRQTEQRSGLGAAARERTADNRGDAEPRGDRPTTLGRRADAEAARRLTRREPAGQAAGGEARAPSAGPWPNDRQAGAASEPQGSNEPGFDPTQITEPDQPVEAVSGFGVPDFSHEEEPAPTSAEEEFDFIMDPIDGGHDEVSAGQPPAAAEQRNADRPAASAAALAVGASLASRQADDFTLALDQELNAEFGSRPAQERPATDGSADVSAAPVDIDDSHRDDPYSQQAFYDQAADEAAAPGAVEVEDRDSRRRRYSVAAAVVGLAVLGGAAAYAWSQFGGAGGPSDAPPVIAADGDPVKIQPADPGGATVPNQDSAVYDRVAGAGNTQPPQEALVSTTEEPVDIVQRTIDPDMLPLNTQPSDDGAGLADAAETAAAGPAESADAPDAAKAEDRLAAAGNQQTGTMASDQRALVEPRRVRTLIVRPDGSLEPSPPPSEAPAAADGGVTDVGLAPAPGETAPASDSDRPVESAGIPSAEADGTATPVENGEASSQATTGADAVETAAADPDAGAVVVSAPVPATRPAEQPVTVVGTVSDRGIVSDGAGVAATARAGTGGYSVQIASQPTEAGAQASFRNLSARYAAIIGGRDATIQRADIPGKGIYYRVRIPAGSRTEAIALCERYQAAGGSCFVAR